MRIKELDNEKNLYIDMIDSKFDILFKHMEYREYLNFIRSDKYICLYDDVLGKYCIDYPYSKTIIKMFNNVFYLKVLEKLNNKIKELNIDGLIN